MANEPTLNGQILGQAERGARAVLDRLLADHDTGFDQWIALRQLALNPTIGTGRELIDQYATLVGTTASEAASVVDQLANRGWIAVADGDRIELTAAGTEDYQTLNEGALAIGARLYGDLPADDLAAAARVLLTLTERAREALAA
jgi:DNA-binding MarR family transcriptional regulator